MDESPVEPTNNLQDTKKPKTWLWILIIVLVAAVVGIGVYMWQQSQIRTLQSQVDNLESQVDVLKQPTPEPTTSNDQPAEGTTEYTSVKGEKVRVTAPKANSVVASPLVITGEVKGSWSFEATFPVEITDNKKAKIADSYATLQGEWMTTDYVPFTANLNFTRPANVSNGFLILRNANPSGQADKDDHVEIPIKF